MIRHNLLFSHLGYATAVRSKDALFAYCRSADNGRHILNSKLSSIIQLNYAIVSHSGRHSEGRKIMTGTSRASGSRLFVDWITIVANTATALSDGRGAASGGRGSSHAGSVPFDIVM
jgi:hypothetical protein